MRSTSAADWAPKPPVCTGPDGASLVLTCRLVRWPLASADWLTALIGVIAAAAALSARSVKAVGATFGAMLPDHHLPYVDDASTTAATAHNAVICTWSHASSAWFRAAPI
jgi:hypothetical protein